MYASICFRKENDLTKKSFECAQIGDVFNKNIEINER